MQTITKRFGQLLTATIFGLAILTANTVAATFTVTNTNDSGAGSLRQAVLDANTAAGSDIIVFDASFNTARTITLASIISVSHLIGDTLTITGPGANLLTINGNNAVQIFLINTSRTASISGMTLTRANGGVQIGGAIQNSGNLTVANSVFDSNESRGGGAIGNTLSLTINNCTFTNNRSTGTGGGLNGGGAVFSNVTIAISNSTFTGNSEIGGGGGGAVSIQTNTNAPATITNTVIDGNSATGNGGGIYVSFGLTSPITITNSTISNNTANSDSNTTGDGGGLYLTGTGTATVSNSTVSGNRVNGGTTSGRGGGIYIAGSTATVNIESSTIVNNTAAADGGGVNRAGATVNFRNTIVANNTVGGTAPDIFGTVNSNGYNLIRNTTGATITGTTTGNITGVDPYLTKGLRNNGGATLTYALRPCSAAIDAGDPTTFPATDQRGIARPQDGDGNGTLRSDIGAYERRLTDFILAEPFDFDNDCKADISVFRPSNRVWYSAKSSDNGILNVQWGLATDKLAPGDYNGDGKTDYVVVRDGFWFILYNGGTVEGFQLGIAGDIPAPADFDGDGKTDAAIFRNGLWAVRNSSTGGTTAFTFGSAGDVPTPADFDGDNKADYAVWRSGAPMVAAFQILQSNGVFRTELFGQTGDVPTVADYDGDGKADPATYRAGAQSFFYYRGSLNNPSNNVTYLPWGITGDIPAPADYDGDGKTDIAVFRNGVWYILRTTGGVQIFNFGLTGDKPVPSAFVP